MYLSKRLQAIVDMIPENVTVVDIGCDHALLDIFLTERGKNTCIATDIRSGVIELAKRNIQMHHLEDTITLVQSDGLQSVIPPNGSVAVIAGMGTTTILQILNNPKIYLFSEFIIQTNNEWEFLRKEVSKRGFQIIEERVLLDRSKYYILMKWTKGKTCYSTKQCFLGPLLMLSKESKSYYQYLFQQYIQLYAKIPFYCFSKKYHIYQRLQWLKKRKEQI